ncbi:unnamed protein product [Brachionus calyciflorus]|uniref:Uncharacterized protein n=1 Tax=Brachionus calyciflorus TaxID=104777 RepID=A0A814Q7T2_9BILA|nr:unnamed protein product [Brachionus calyciflorus]
MLFPLLQREIKYSPTSSGTNVNKRRLDFENNHENLDVTLPKKKRERKLGSKNKKDIEKERLEKEKNEKEKKISELKTASAELES